MLAQADIHVRGRKRRGLWNGEGEVMDLLNAIAVVVGYTLQIIFFVYSIFLANKDRYQEATYCLSLSIVFLLMVRLTP